MKKVIALLLLACPIFISAAQGACPAGSTCGPFTTLAQTVTSRNTNRTDPRRWADHWKTFPEVGIDCTGNTDSTSALQSAINAMPNNSTLVAPIGCKTVLSSTITITDRSGITIMSMQRPSDAAAPRFVWNASGGTMFSVQHSTAPTFKGFPVECRTRKDG